MALKRVKWTTDWNVTKFVLFSGWEIKRSVTTEIHCTAIPNVQLSRIISAGFSSWICCATRRKYYWKFGSSAVWKLHQQNAKRMVQLRHLDIKKEGMDPLKQSSHYTTSKVVRPLCHTTLLFPLWRSGTVLCVMFIHANIQHPVGATTTWVRVANATHTVPTVTGL